MFRCSISLIVPKFSMWNRFSVELLIISRYLFESMDEWIYYMQVCYDFGRVLPYRIYVKKNQKIYQMMSQFSENDRAFL